MPDAYDERELQDGGASSNFVSIKTRQIEACATAAQYGNGIKTSALRIYFIKRGAHFGCYGCALHRTIKERNFKLKSIHIIKNVLYKILITSRRSRRNERNTLRHQRHRQFFIGI